MADANGNVPGDPGYDASTDSNNTNNGDGTFTDNQGNVMDQGGGLISAAPSSTAYTGVGSSIDPGVNPSAGTLVNYTDPTTGGIVGTQPTPAVSSGDTGAQPGSPTNPAQPAPAQPDQPQPAQPGSVDLSGINAQLSSLDDQLNALLRAMSATNEQDFQEAIREFNIKQQNAVNEFNAQYGGTLPNGQPTLQAIAQQAQLTGMYNGQPTEAARQFNINTQADLAKLAAGLSGPADYFKYLNALNAGRSILGNLSSGQAMPAGGAPQGAIQPQTLGNILSNLGIGGTSSQGGTGGTVGTGQVNTNTGSGLALPYGMGQLPYANQIQPTAYNSLSPSGQQFVQGAYAAAGYDPADLQRSILASTPAATGAGGSSGATQFASPNSQSLFG